MSDKTEPATDEQKNWPPATDEQIAWCYDASAGRQDSLFMYNHMVWGLLARITALQSEIGDANKRIGDLESQNAVLSVALENATREPENRYRTGTKGYHDVDEFYKD